MAKSKHFSALFLTLWGFATSASAMLWTRENDILAALHSAYEAKSQADWVAACTHKSLAGMGWLCTYAADYGFVPVVVGGLATVVMAALVFCNHVGPSFSQSPIWAQISSGVMGVLALGCMVYGFEGMGNVGTLMVITVLLIVALGVYWRSLTRSFRRWTMGYLVLQTLLWGSFLLGSQQLAQHERRRYDQDTYLMHREQAQKILEKEAASPDKKVPNQYAP